MYHTTVGGEGAEAGVGWPQRRDHTRVLGLCRLSAGSQSRRLAVETSGGLVTLRSALALNVPHVSQYLSIFENSEHH